MDYFYASQYQQLSPQESIAYTQQQYPQHQHTQHQHPQYQQSYDQYPQYQQSYHQAPQYQQSYHQAPQYQQSYHQVPSNVLHTDATLYQQPEIPVSSYSALAGAVDYSNSNSSRTNHVSSVHKSHSSTNPYPVLQHDNAIYQDRTRGHSQTQALASTSRSTRQCPIQDYKQAQKVLVDTPEIPPPSGPTNHILVPQPDFFDERDKLWRYGPRFPHITFQTAGFPELGVRVGKVAHSIRPPPIEGAKDEVFAVCGNREVQIRILWPGYSSEPLVKRIKTQGGKITRELLLTILSHTVLDFTFYIHKKKILVELGYEMWTIGSKEEENTIVGGELFITRIVHRGGSNWQVELWTPKVF